MPRRSPAPRPALETGELSPARMALFTYGVPLIFLGAVLLLATRFFAVTSAEALTIDEGAHPIGEILRHFAIGLSPQRTPSLYALGLHIWLFLSAGSFAWLRAPSALFYIAGVWLLSRAASRGGDTQSAAALLLSAAVWPYGFHHGTLATWYSFAFVLTCALILTHLRFAESPNQKTWIVFCLLGVALLYTSYLGWAVLIFLGLSDWLEHRKQGRPAAKRLLETAAFFIAAYVPLWSPFLRDMGRALRSHPGLRGVALSFGYHLYVLLASESVAPWFWRFGVPAALAVVLSMVVALIGLRGPARRFLIFGGALILLMALAGSLDPNRLLLVAPWFMLPLAVGLGSMESKYLNRTLLTALLLVSAIGWYGTYMGHRSAGNAGYYAEPELLEPWGGLAAGVAGAVHQGAGVISNSPSFFLYLTYALEEPPASGTPWRYRGSLPETVKHPHIWSPAMWEAAGRAVQPYTIWMRGTASSPAGAEGMEAAAKLLDQRCGGRVTRFLMRDPSFTWRQRLFPQPAGEPWRVEVHQYECDQAAAPAPAAPPSAAPPSAPPRARQNPPRAR